MNVTFLAVSLIIGFLGSSLFVMAVSLSSLRNFWAISECHFFLAVSLIIGFLGPSLFVMAVSLSSLRNFWAISECHFF